MEPLSFHFVFLSRPNTEIWAHILTLRLGRFGWLSWLSGLLSLERLLLCIRFCLLISSMLFFMVWIFTFHTSFSKANYSVLVDRDLSQPFPVNAGVPRDFILAPTPFPLLVNGLPTTSGPLHCFIDDAIPHSSLCYSASHQTTTNTGEDRIVLTASLSSDPRQISAYCLYQPCFFQCFQDRPFLIHSDISLVLFTWILIRFLSFRQFLPFVLLTNLVSCPAPDARFHPLTFYTRLKSARHWEYSNHVCVEAGLSPFLVLIGWSRRTVELNKVLINQML